MRMTLSILIRMIAFLGVASTILAVGVSRAVPKGLTSVTHAEVAPRYYGVNGSVFFPHQDDNFLVDTETGRLCPLHFGKNLSLDNVTCSPWRDEQGAFQLAGRYTKRSGEHYGKMCEDSGLASARVATRELLGQHSLQTLVTAPPCWLAGPRGRVVFPAGDGNLYTQTLTDGDSAPAAVDSSPRAIRWDTGDSGSPHAIIADAVCPPIPALGGKLIVAIHPGARRDDQVTFGHSELWWLELNRDATAITRAGRLLTPERPGQAEGPAEKRQPNLTVMPDGRVVMAYLSRPPGRLEWSLRVVTVSIDPSTGEPSASGGEGRNVAEDCAATIPPFSADGRWLYVIPRATPVGDGLARVPVADLLDGL